MFIGSFWKSDETFPILASNIKTPVDNITTFHMQETLAFLNVEKKLTNYEQLPSGLHPVVEEGLGKQSIYSSHTR